MGTEVLFLFSVELQNGVTDHQVHHSRVTTSMESDLSCSVTTSMESELSCSSTTSMESDLSSALADNAEPLRSEGQPNKRRRHKSIVPASFTNCNATYPLRKQNRSNHDIAIMIIMHEYPLQIVEDPGFVHFVKTLQPQFKMMSFTTVQEQIASIYLREKESLFHFLCGIPSRISLSLDIWNSNHTFGYVLLRGHFIDNNWNSHCRILNAVRIPPPYGDDALNLAVFTCLSNWRLDGRIFALTIDQSLLNDTIAENLRAILVNNDPNFLNGQLLLRNCLAQVLCQLAQDALSSTSEVVLKIHESVKYVKASYAREEKFLELKHQLQVLSARELSIPHKCKWDATYLMLAAACELKEVFSCFDTSDPNYELTLSEDDWKLADTLCTYLKYFFDVANILTFQSYPTTNVFFSKVSKIQMELTHGSMSQDPFVHYLTKPLKEKFDRYWNDSCLVLAMAAVMDPRSKLKLVEFTFSKVFDQNAEDWFRIVDYGLHDLFLQYTMETPALSETFREDGNGDVSMTKTEKTHQEGHQREILELDRYLEEELLPRSQEFDILNWWRLNRYRYPALSKMACDILSMPVSTVARDLVFDTEIIRMDSYRTSLPLATLEALICTRDWLQSGSLLSPSLRRLMSL